MFSIPPLDWGFGGAIGARGGLEAGEEVLRGAWLTVG